MAGMANGITASNFKAIGKSTLVGSVDLEITSWHLSFKGVLWHRKNEREWLSFPAREWLDPVANKKMYSNFIQWTDKAVEARFQKAALAAVHAIHGLIPNPSQ